METLGFEVQTDVPAALFVSAGGYHHHIGANTWHHRTGPASGRGLAWFEILLPDSRTLGVVRERLAARGVPYTDLDTGIAVRDQDEIGVRIRAES